MFQAGVFAWPERWNALRLQSGSGRPQKAAIYNSGNRSSFTMQKLWWNVIHRWEMRSNFKKKLVYMFTSRRIVFQDTRKTFGWRLIRYPESNLTSSRWTAWKKSALTRPARASSSAAQVRFSLHKIMWSKGCRRPGASFEKKKIIEGVLFYGMFLSLEYTVVMHNSKTQENRLMFYWFFCLTSRAASLAA